LKIWGLDFGDCHKSFLAHQDAVTTVRFAGNTHYVFSVGKDHMIKQWDADRFLQIQVREWGKGGGMGTGLHAVTEPSVAC